MRDRFSTGGPIRVCFPFVGNNVGGSHISTIILCNNLDRRQVEPVIVLHEDGPLADYAGAQGLDFELLPIDRYFQPPYRSFRNLSALTWQTIRIARYLQKRKIDIVHANDMRIQYGWSLATRLGGAHLVWHQRTGTFGRSRVKLLLALLASEILCISKYTAATLPQQLTRLVRIVANPFETSFMELSRQEARVRLLEHLGLRPETLLVGFFGNLVEQKRPAIFIRAAAEIAKHTDQPLAFVLCGAKRNNAEAELTELATNLGIEKLVHLMGFQAPVEPWMAGCDVTIAPAVGEGLGRSLIESMIVGTPVVAADSGGHRDVISDGTNGLLAKPDDPTSLAEAACRILQDETLANSLADSAQATIQRDYSVTSHVEAVVASYLRSLGVSRSEVGVPNAIGRDFG